MPDEQPRESVVVRMMHPSTEIATEVSLENPEDEDPPLVHSESLSEPGKNPASISSTMAVRNFLLETNERMFRSIFGTSAFDLELFRALIGGFLPISICSGQI